MAVDSYGTHGQPNFDENARIDDAAEKTALGDYAARVGNRMVGTSGERAVFKTKFSVDPWNGLLFHETDTGIEWKYVAGAWKRWHSDWQILNAGINLYGGTGDGGEVQWRYEDGSVHVTGRFILTPGFFFNSPNGGITFTLPVQAHAKYGFPGASRMVFYDNASSGASYATPYLGLVRFDDGYTVRFCAPDKNSSTGRMVPATATVPFTFDVNDFFEVDFTYRPV